MIELNPLKMAKIKNWCFLVFELAKIKNKTISSVHQDVGKQYILLYIYIFYIPLVYTGIGNKQMADSHTHMYK